MSDPAVLDSGQFVPAVAGVAVGPPTRESRADQEFWPASDQIREEIDSVLTMQLSDALTRWVDAYGSVGHRGTYLWNWCRRAVELTTLPSVSPDRYDELCDTKVLGVMLDVMWDDVADQSGNDRLLDRLLSIPFQAADIDIAEFSPAEQDYFRFTQEVWREIEARARKYPRYEEFNHLLEFDYLQLSNVMRYSHLLNAEPELLNLAEHDVYTPHNMHIMICSTFDLMCSPDFDRQELGRTREIIWHAQWMGRIGNLVTTWRRELDEGDFTSGVYASAVSCEDVSVSDLLEGNAERIEAAIKQGQHEEVFLERWQEHRRFLRSRRSTLQSFDVRELVRGLERLFCLHLGSRGHK